MGLHLGVTSYAPIVMYVGAIVAALLSIFKNPRIGLYFLVPLLPMQTARYWLHQYFGGEKLVDVLLFAVVIGLFIRSEKPVFIASRMNKVIIIFSVLTFIALWEGSLLQGLPMPVSFADERLSNWKNYVEMMCIFFIAAAALKTPKHMSITLALICLSVVVVNRNYHSTIADRDYSQFSDDLRDAGPLGYAGENGMGAFQAQMAIFLIGLTSFCRKKLVRFGLWAVAFTCIYCLVFTFSRGGYLGFLLGILVLGLIRERKLLVVLAVFLVVWQAVLPKAVHDRIFMTYQEGEGLDASAQERVAIWHDAWDVVTHNPVLGNGFNTYEFMGRVGPYKDTHNYYLKIVLELGFVGLAVFLWLIACAGQMAWRLFRTASNPLFQGIGCAMVATVTCAALVNLFGDRWSYLQVNGFLWLFLGMAARALWLTNKEQELAEQTDSASETQSADMTEAFST